MSDSVKICPNSFENVNEYACKTVPANADFQNKAILFLIKLTCKELAKKYKII